MDKIMDTTALVKIVLEERPETRSNDDLLYLSVCHAIRPFAVINSFNVIMAHRAELGLPPYETVRRTRQKLQATYPELAAKRKVKVQRVKREKVFREYALTDLKG